MSETLPEPPELQDEVVEQLLPIDDVPLEPEEELARLDDELEAFPDSDDIVVTEEEALPIGRSWAFDFQARRFVRGVRAQGPLETRGQTTLRYWIEKCLRTARGAHPIHPEDYGMNDPTGVYGLPLAEAQGADLEGDIRDALTFHPKIVDVTDFYSAYNPDEDYLAVSFTVVLDDESALEFTEVPLGT